jgi:hypothetical protein
VETASATTLDVPYPGSISAGDRLLCIMATKNGGTFSASGWSNVSTQFGVTSGIQIGALWKEATGSESGSLTVTKSAAGVMAGVMLRVTGSDLIYMAGQGNASSTSVTAPATQIFTPWATFLWVAAIDTDQSITDPGADWFPLSTGLAANQAIRLVVSVAVASAHGDFPDPPIFNAYENDHFPAQVGSVGVAGTSAAGTIILQAENGS